MKTFQFRRYLRVWLLQPPQISLKVLAGAAMDDETNSGGPHVDQATIIQPWGVTSSSIPSQANVSTTAIVEKVLSSSPTLPTLLPGSCWTQAMILLSLYRLLITLVVLRLVLRFSDVGKLLMVYLPILLLESLHW
jgi:hypothetical protein